MTSEMPSRVVISDASTVIGLVKINSLGLLQSLYKEVEITSIVSHELGMELPNWIKTNDSYNSLVFQSLTSILDAGEASAIALALEQKESLLIIDERKGRKHASLLGLKITGLLGILIRAKREGHINSGREKLDLLRSGGFHLSQKIYEIALERMEEV